ncbi:MAG: phenylacetate--CoA ligase family protein [Chromatiales bacterium]
MNRLDEGADRDSKLGRQRRAAAEFFEVDLDTRLQRSLDHADAHLLALFQEAAMTVPAYGEFLREHGIDAHGVRTPEDVRRLPLLTKENYLRRYPLPMRCRDGRLDECDMIAVSSGSTGEPRFWPRSVSDEYDVALRFEQVFRDSFRADERTTLAIVCFALGTWVGGMYTAACLRHLAAKGYALTLVTPGNNREEVFRVFGALAPDFDQVVLLGYPPFIKEIIDTGMAQGVHWGRPPVRVVLAGEVFSEEWRTLVLERLGAPAPCFDAVSLYGTADGGVLGNETPLSVAIRRWFAAHPGAARELFGESRLPTLVQYDPLSRYFEVHDGTLVFSGDNGVPLIRYHISDEGGILRCAEMLELLHRRGYDPIAEIGSDCRGVRELPFVYVFGRSHFVVSYFGANIYPENVMVGLEQAGIREWVTGKFVMQVAEGADRNRRLHVVVELAPGEQVSDLRRALVAQSIRGHLCRLNSEFANYVPVEHQLPVVDFRPAGDPEWFPTGGKHRYSRRQEAGADNA